MLEKKPQLNGSTASKRSDKPSINAPPSLDSILGSIFDAFQKHTDRKMHALMKKDFVFHMTDWEEDLRRLYGFFEKPTHISRDEAQSVIADFLYHATAHIRSAANLMLDFDPPAFGDPRGS